MSDPKDDDNRDDPALSALIEAVADGEDVDWERVRSSAGSKREQDSIDALSTVALLSKLVQVFGEAPPVPEPTRPGALHGAGAPGASRRRPGSRDVGLSPDSRQARSGDVRDRVPRLGAGAGSSGRTEAVPRAEAGRRDVG